MTLRPGDIDDWPRIAACVESVLARCHEPWTVDDVRTKLASGDAHLLLAPDGFLIFTLKTTPAGRDLWVWIAYATGGRFFERYQAQVEQLARDCGAHAIAFASPRPGFARRLGPEWTTRSVTYEWRLTDG